MVKSGYWQIFFCIVEVAKLRKLGCSADEESEGPHQRVWGPKQCQKKGGTAAQCDPTLGKKRSRVKLSRPTMSFSHGLMNVRVRPQ